MGFEPTPPKRLVHHGSVLEEEEELSPTLENFVILTWLRLINPALPKLVPCLITSVAGRVRIPNLSDRPYVLKRNEHFCQVNPVFCPSTQDQPSNPVDKLPYHKVCSVPVSESKYSQGVALVPDNLVPPGITSKFRNLLVQYDSVFDPAIGSLRIDDFCTTPPLDCVTCSLRMRF